MKTESQYFDEAISIQKYMNQMSTLREESLTVYLNFKMPLDGLIEQIADFGLKFLVITEDWCGDAMMITPIIRNIAEAAHIDTRVVLRDEDTSLIDRYLTNGGRAIPIVVILSEDGQILGKWGPRAPEVQQIVDELHAKLPDKNDPDYEKARATAIGSLRTRYAVDDTLWMFVYQSLKRTVQGLLRQ
ncbi:thioredoxin family protein [Paenibacillus sp. PCH8]|uniref:thioredoxin family protein n=1 Tax=Paenibacillus sp. PCH8 TaxID=2066524 RepID=UPI000CFA6C33|nr:thioredoxin family protein [Paenibacillus sp. PCH8]PQP81058.1 thioredoxin family protein [Paenibacillus sp. PCH8]